MTSIVTLGLGFLSADYSKLFDIFQMKPFIMTFLENTEQEIANLHDLLHF
jgi:hypothetical protein